MIRRGICLVAILFMANEPFAQEAEVVLPFPEIIPVSPETHGLGKYGDIPTNLYTGVPDISIPLYNVTFGELSLPISLSYHATGVQVSQEASWVGLGWNLIAGGAISYIPVGGNDQLVFSPTVPGDFIKLLDYVAPTTFPQAKPEDHYTLWDCVPGNDDRKVTNNVAFRVLNGYGEQDIYSANFLGYSFKFFKNPRNHSFEFLGQRSNVKIARVVDSSGISITGDDGTVYLFDSFESVTTPQGTFYQGYYLTKITHPAGDEIILKYSHVPVRYIPTLHEYVEVYSTMIANQAVRNFSHDYGPNLVPFLDTIETKNELIIFEKDSIRDDLQGGVKLKRMIIKDRVSEREKYFYEFHYSYFDGVNTGGSYLNDGTFDATLAQIFTEDKVKKRLKLDGIGQKSGGEPHLVKEYAFDYNMTVPLPYKTSSSIDHWGYYNGQNNEGSLFSGASHTIIPRTITLISDKPSWMGNIPVECFKSSGAIRGASATYMTAGMLKSIRFPTGGRTEFEFEPHDFDNRQHISAEDEVEHITATYNGVELAAVISYPKNPMYTVSEREFTISEKVLVEFFGTLKGDFVNPYMTLEVIEGTEDFSTIVFNYDNRTFSSPDNLAEWSKSFWLPPGTYSLKIHADGNFSDFGLGPLIHGTLVTSKFFQEDLSLLPSLGGGVRVSQITDFDSDGAVVSSKKYSYLDENKTTSGRLLLPIKYHKFRQLKIGIGVTVPTLYWSTYTTSKFELYGNSYITLSGTTYGNNVGYDRVEVETVTISGEGNGKEVLYFSNNLPYSYTNGISFYGSYTNGDLKRRVVLDSAGDTVRVEEYTYSILPDTEIISMSNAKIEDNYIGPTDYCIGDIPYNPLAYIGRFMIYAYPYHSYFSAQTNSRVLQYFPTGKVVSETEYDYGSTHLQLSERKAVSSLGDTIKELYYYPMDYYDAAGANLSALKSKNIIKPIKIEKTVNDKQVSGNVLSYNENGQVIERFEYRNSTLSPAILHDPHSCLSPQYKPAESWSYFNGRPSFHTDVDGVRRLYYWWGDRLIMSVEGMVDWSELEDVVLASIPSGYSDIEELLADMYDIGVNDSKKATWNDFNTSLRAYLEASIMVTTYTHDAVYGMTSQTAPNGDPLYYEYDDFGRLLAVRDRDANVISIYRYNYRVQH